MALDDLSAEQILALDDLWEHIPELGKPKGLPNPSLGTLIQTLIDETGQGSLLTELASTATGEGASLIGIEDSGGLFTATTVEDALSELRTKLNTIDGNLKRFTVTTGAEGAASANAFDVQVACIDGDGTAVATQPTVIVRSHAVTPDQGDLAAGTTPSGTLVQAINPTTGANTAAFTPTAGGLFTVKVSDTAVEKVLVTIEGAGFETAAFVLQYA